MNILQFLHMGSVQCDKCIPKNFTLLRETAIIFVFNFNFKHYYSLNVSALPMPHAKIKSPVC